MGIVQQGNTAQILAVNIHLFIMTAAPYLGIVWPFEYTDLNALLQYCLIYEL